MYRATSPHHKFEFPAELAPIEQNLIRMAYKQGEDVILLKEYDNTDPDSHTEITTESGGTAYIYPDCRMESNWMMLKLTQEETNLFDPNRTVRIQARVLTAMNEVIASDYVVVPLKDCLEDEIIEERD